MTEGFCRLPPKKGRCCLFFEKACGWAHIQGVPHLLPSQWHTAVYAFKYVQSCSIWHLRINEVKSQIAILNSVLDLRRKVRESLSVQSDLFFKLEP